MSKNNMAKAILTDAQFWIPVVVLGLGIALLIVLH
ncbi:translocated intimin receptor Tir [Terriglobus roseus]|nr:translocated intimin receptor Tir [Terriglobus roseus]